LISCKALETCTWVISFARSYWKISSVFCKSSN